jgi:hypothetical protein
VSEDVLDKPGSRERLATELAEVLMNQPEFLLAHPSGERRRVRVNMLASLLVVHADILIRIARCVDDMAHRTDGPA